MPASKRQRLAALQRLLLQLGGEERSAALPSVLGEVRAAYAPRLRTAPTHRAYAPRLGAAPG